MARPSHPRWLRWGQIKDDPSVALTETTQQTSLSTSTFVLSDHKTKPIDPSDKSRRCDSSSAPKNHTLVPGTVNQYLSHQHHHHHQHQHHLLVELQPKTQQHQHQPQPQQQPQLLRLPGSDPSFHSSTTSSTNTNSWDNCNSSAGTGYCSSEFDRTISLSRSGRFLNETLQVPIDDDSDIFLDQETLETATTSGRYRYHSSDTFSTSPGTSEDSYTTRPLQVSISRHKLEPGITRGNTGTSPTTTTTTTTNTTRTDVTEDPEDPMKRRVSSSSKKKIDKRATTKQQALSSSSSSTSSSALSTQGTEVSDVATAGDRTLSPLNRFWNLSRRRKSSKKVWDPTWLIVMGFMVGFIAIAAIVLALRNRPSTHTYPSVATTDGTGTSMTTTGTTSAKTLRDQKWESFDGHATVTNQYKIIQRFPHDPTAFTQGLQWHNDRLVESTGMYGESQVKIWDPKHGSTVELAVNLDPAYFGEGLCWFQDAEGNDRFIQLTWQEQTAFVYDTQLQIVRQFNYTTTTSEGWGITFDPVEQEFYVSDGSDTIIIWNLNFEEIRSLRVSLLLRNVNQNTNPYLKLINELEWDPNDQTLLANVWFQNAIVRIHPQTGQVLQIVDLSKLYVDRDATADVMNGIAHHQGNQWWITGKYWPYLYLVDFNGE